MKISTVAALALILPAVNGFTSSAFGVTRSSTFLSATAKPPRVLEQVLASNDPIPCECAAFNAVKVNDELMFEQVIEIIDGHYDSVPIEFRNGDVINKAGENSGTAKLLSYAALSNMDEKRTLKLWGQHYRDVLNDPDGDSHQNIRNFMKYGWEGVSLDEGIALTRKI